MGQKESKLSSKHRRERTKNTKEIQSTNRAEQEKQNPSPSLTDTRHNAQNDPQTASQTAESSASSPVERRPSIKENPPQQKKEVSTGKSGLEAYFQKYKDPTEDAILAEGVENFCDDLGVSPTDFVVLVLAWKFQASEMCRFTREEFMNGCQKLKAIDAKGLRKRFPDLIKETNESDKSFKELYQFTFTFGLDHGSGQRALPTEMAVQLWDLLFTHKKHSTLFSRWLDFLQNTDIKTITRDTWNMFLPFLQTMNDSLDNYDDLEAWPTLFDDFVEYETERHAVN